MAREFTGDTPPRVSGEVTREQPIVITPTDWLKGVRPEGYQSTTVATERAHKHGESLGDLTALNPGVFDKQRWNGLIAKAKSEGLTQKEAEEVAQMSVKMNRIFNQVRYDE